MSVTGGHQVRAPRPDEAEELGRLHVRIWRDTYPGMMSPEALARLDASRFAAMWRSLSEADSHPRVARIAVGATGDPVGFAIVGPARDDDPPTPTQLYALSIDRAHHGSGVATALLEAALGPGPAYLWVVEQNTRAIAFYRKHGFEPDGATMRDEELGADEIRMVRR